MNSEPTTVVLVVMTSDCGDEQARLLRLTLPTHEVEAALENADRLQRIDLTHPSLDIASAIDDPMSTWPHLSAVAEWVRELDDDPCPSHRARENGDPNE